MNFTRYSLNNSKFFQRGFSIVELLVAMGLFVIIISVTVNIFIRTVKTQKTALLLIEANDNLASTIEQMTLEARWGTNFKNIACDLKSTANSLEFINSNGQEVKYYLANGSIFKEIKNEGSLQITADGIEIKRFAVSVSDCFGGRKYPPRIFVRISAAAKGEVLKDIPIDIQTTVSSRTVSL